MGIHADRAQGISLQGVGTLDLPPGAAYELRNVPPGFPVTSFAKVGERTYPPVNVQKTMEHHHFQWVNQL